MSSLGELTPEFLCSDIDDDKTWGELWNHFSNEMYKFSHPPIDWGDAEPGTEIPPLGSPVKEHPPRNWNQHFCGSKRLLRYGLVFTPVEENGYGPFQLRYQKGEEGDDQYVAKYLRTREIIENSWGSRCV